MDMSETLIRFHAVDFSYDPHRPVLAQCDFQLQRGGRVALTGSNGSGKTTLLHLIVGLLRPGSGRVEVFDEVRRRETDYHEVRRRVGLVFQDADDQLFCPTVAEDVAFGPMNLGKSREQARQIVGETLHSLGLGGYENRITYKLSGGEKRLVALATVLAMQPDVLLLDEPISGLDDRAIQRLLKILAALPQAMIIVSHNREFLKKATTSAVRLSDGKVEAVELG